ncbi:MAG: uroporphyrinogen decarboxylase [Betaproteobacteria bacterium]|nr:MAG: uroporphyrinogen decarboxylase [Betaproteobacteria bacterium]
MEVHHRKASLKNDTFLRALARQPTAYTPVWLMRQAGRYLPEYKATRARAGSFLGLAKTPELCAQVALQPIERFDLDAAIVFSDILTIPDAMGLGLSFGEGEGPRFERPLRDEASIRALSVPDPTVELRYVLDAVRVTREALADRVPLIGFSGSPFTLACYMIEGGGSDDWRNVKALLHSRPELLHRVLEVNARAVSDYLNAQIDAGAQAVMLFDTWGGTLAYNDYEPFSLAYSKKVLGAVSRVPRILFTKGGNPWLAQMMASGADAIGLDWTSDPRHARKLAGGRVALQGNLDPAALFGPPERVREAARRVIDAFGRAPGHVFNLGHGVLQGTPIDSVAALVDEVRTYSRTRA